jgi:hypothetical protein
MVMEPLGIDAEVSAEKLAVMRRRTIRAKVTPSSWNESTTGMREQ